MFGQCYLLISFNLSNFDTSKVTDMIRMFDNYPKLNELNIIGSVNTFYIIIK